MTTFYILHTSSRLMNYGIRDVLFTKQFNSCRNLHLGSLRLSQAINNYISCKENPVFVPSSSSSKTVYILSNKMTSGNCLSKRYNSNKVADNVSTSKQPAHDATLETEKVTVEQKAAVSKVQMLKKAIAEYGSTVIVFHISISLISLGICYMLVSSGVDTAHIFEKLGLSESKIASNASTFVAAYAIHKVMAPLRISVTLGAAPLIVRYLRNKGILKK